MRGDSLHVEMKALALIGPLRNSKANEQITCRKGNTAAQPHRFICAACNGADPLEPSYCNICYDTMGQPRRCKLVGPVEDGPHEFRIATAGAGGFGVKRQNARCV